MSQNVVFYLPPSICPTNNAVWWLNVKYQCDGFNSTYHDKTKHHSKVRGEADSEKMLLLLLLLFGYLRNVFISPRKQAWFPLGDKTR